MVMVTGFDRLRRVLLVPTLIAVFVAFLLADPVKADCGVIPAQDSQNVILNPGEVVSSCSGKFSLMYKDDGSVVLQYTPTGQVIWQSTAEKGKAYAFNSLGNSGLDSGAAAIPSPSNADSTANAGPSPGPDKLDLSANKAPQPTLNTWDLSANPVPSTNPGMGSMASLPSSSDMPFDPNAVPGFIPQDSTGNAQPATLPPASNLPSDPSMASTVPADNVQLDANSAFLSSPSDSSITTRRRMRKRYNSFSASPVRLNVQDDGNLVMSDGGMSALWTSDTKGTDCSQVFFPDVETEALASKAESKQGGSDLASLIRQDPCALLNVAAENVGGESQQLAADPQDPINLVSRAAKKGRTVINEYNFVLKTNPSNPKGWIIPIGSARLKKTWYFDGKTVSNAWGNAPDKASVDGETYDMALAVGFSYGFIGRGSELDVFSDYHENGRGAHTSVRRVMLNFETQFFRSLYAFKYTMRQELYIKAFADGKVDCQGQSHCREVRGP